MKEPQSPSNTGKPDDAVLRELAEVFGTTEDDSDATVATDPGTPPTPTPGAPDAPTTDAPDSADAAAVPGAPAARDATDAPVAAADGPVAADDGGAGPAMTDGTPPAPGDADERVAGDEPDDLAADDGLEPDDVEAGDELEAAADAPDDADDAPTPTPLPGPNVPGEPGFVAAAHDEPDEVDEVDQVEGGRQTIRIGADGPDDDLPDAVYLDDELAKDGSEGTVFIDDDEIEDAVAPEEAGTGGIEPRIRQRRIGVRRAAGRKRLKWVVVGGAVALVLLTGLAVLGSPLFRIQQVDVTGAVYTDAAVLEDVVDDLEGTNVFIADTNAATDRLEAVPWVERARVSTDFPDRASIEIREREPLITMRGVDGLFRVADREGRVLDSIEGQPVAMVLITGPGTLDVEPGGFTDVGYAAAASLVTKFTPEIRTRVESMQVTPDGTELRLVLTNEPDVPINVVFGSALGENDQIEKLVRLQRVLDDIGRDPVRVIDVSTAEVTIE